MDRKREQALIRSAQRGDSRAIAALYRAHIDRIYRYIFFRVDQNGEVAEDITSDVFLRMVEGLPNYEDRAMPLIIWLYRIAHARVVDYYRRSKRTSQQENIDSIEIGDHPDLDIPLVHAYQSEQLQAAMNDLTDGQRQVIVLRFVEGYNLEQTARLLGKTVDAVKAMQYRALQALGMALRRQGYEPGQE